VLGTVIPEAAVARKGDRRDRAWDYLPEIKDQNDNNNNNKSKQNIEVWIDPSCPCSRLFPAEWLPDLGPDDDKGTQARAVQWKATFPKRIFFSTIGQLQSFDAPKRHFYWPTKTLKFKRHLFGQSTRLQTFSAPTDTIRHWLLKVALNSTCLVVKSSIMTIMIAGSCALNLNIVPGFSCFFLLFFCKRGTYRIDWPGRRPFLCGFCLGRSWTLAPHTWSHATTHRWPPLCGDHHKLHGWH
jgi:hypothetical protein